MGILFNKLNSLFLQEDSNSKVQKEKEKILEYLKELHKLEAKLWGTDIKTLKGGEENILEDTNHLIHMISKGKHNELKKVLESKNVKHFINDLIEFKKEFNLLKKELREKERLKLLISNFTIKLVDAKNYTKFKNVFLIEKQIYEVLDMQDKEFNLIFSDVYKIKVNNNDEKIEAFLIYLKKIRDVLAGHLDNYKYFEEDRIGYSNTSNLIYELIKIFSQDLD